MTAWLAACAAAALAGPPVHAATLADAHALYRDGRHAQAADAYRELLRERPEDPILRYDLGNALYKAGGPGSLGRAVAEYSRAFERLPRDPDIRHNLDFALRRCGETLVPPGTPKTLHLLFHIFSRAELLGLQWVGYWACLLFGAAFLAGGARREAVRPWLVGALVFWAASGGWLSLRHLTAIESPGVIVGPSTEARSGPGQNFPVSFSAPEGRRVSILSREGGFVEIGVLKEGLRGWVLAQAVEPL